MKKKLLIGLSALLIMFALLYAFVPTVRLFATVTYLNLKETTTFEVKASEPDKLYMNGEINSKSFDQIQKVISENPAIKTIVLLDVPGSLDDETNFKMCKWVREKGLSTYLTSTSHVASGGTDFFVSGVNRYYESGAKIGVHSWRDTTGTEAKDVPKDDPQHEMNRVYIEEMLGTDAFYWYTIYAAPADDIYYMTEDEMKEYELVTEFVK